jgi:hypothetical protein
VTFRQPTIPLAPRSLGNNLDLALLLLRSGLRGYLSAWFLCTAPVAALIGATYRLHSWTFPQASVLFFLAAGVLGTLVAALTGAQVFSARPSLSRAYRLLGPRPWWYLTQRCVRSLLQLPGFFLFLYPGLLLSYHWPFRTEARVLHNIEPILHRARDTQLLDKEPSQLAGIWFTLVGQGLLLWGVLLLTVDFATTWLLGTPVLMGRLGIDPAYADDSGAILRATLQFLWSDPLVLVVELAVALFVFVYLRITWFLSYIDLRVRNDCWDVELNLRQEAAQLQRGIEERTDATAA